VPSVECGLRLRRRPASGSESPPARRKGLLPGGEPLARRDVEIIGIKKFIFLLLTIAICTATPYNLSMVFIEATAFTKYVYTYLTDDEFLGLQSFLLRYPESGKIIPGSGV